MAAALAVALVVPGVVAADAPPLPVLHGYVTDRGTVSVRQCASCEPLTEIAEGDYRFIVHDSSRKHNFRLQHEGTAYQRSTGIRGTTTGRSWGTIELVAGDRWRFRDDATPRKWRLLPVFHEDAQQRIAATDPAAHGGATVDVTVTAS
jgi:hypothetical protein